MSLLEEILSNIKRESPSVDVPPNLKRVVSSSMSKQRTRRRAVVIAVFALVMVAVGYGAILFLESVPRQLLKQDDSRKVLQALKGLKDTSLQTQSIQPAAADSPPQPQPLPATDAGKAAILERGPSEARRYGGNGSRLPLSLEGHGNAPKDSSGVDSQEPAGKTEKDLHLYTAKSCEATGDLAKALAEYRKALELEDRNHLILNNIAGVLIRSGLYKDAGVYAERALAAKKDHVPSLVNLGIAKLKSGETEEGEKCLSIALQLSPMDKAALSNLALLHEGAGEYRKSYDLYRRLAATDEIDGYLGMARVCEKENRTSEAEAIYRKILRRDPDGRTKRLAADRLAAMGSATNSLR